jgi:hypothetical protein
MNIFDPLAGHNFLIKSKKGSNGFITYEDSKFDEKVTSVYESEEEALKDIKENSYSLSEFLKPEFYSSYEDLKSKLVKFLSADKRCKELCPDVFGEETPKEETKKAPKEESKPEPEPEPKPEPKKSKAAPADDDLDDLLASLD